MSTLQHSAFHELFGSTQLFNVGCLLIFLPLTLGEQTALSAVEEQMPLSKVGKGLGEKYVGHLVTRHLTLHQRGKLQIDQHDLSLQAEDRALSRSNKYEHS